MLSGFFHPPSFCANVSLTLLAKTKNSRLDFFNVYLIKSYLGEAACSATPQKISNKTAKKTQANKSTNLFLSNLQSICDDGIHASAKVNGCHLKKAYLDPAFWGPGASGLLIRALPSYHLSSLPCNHGVSPIQHRIFKKKPTSVDFWRHDE